MNQGDTEIMLGELRDSGHEIVTELAESDIIIINTCAVTRTTLNKVVYRIRELHNIKGKKVIIAGCLPLIDLEKIEKIGKFAGIISCRNTGAINDVVERISNGETDVRRITGETEKISGKRFRGPGISAPIAIAEGCVSNCSYCCVKFARGNLRSFNSKKITYEVENELDAGRKEIFITAQDTAAYGLDTDTNLPTLLKKVVSLEGKFRVRVGMMTPDQAKRIMPDLLKAYESDKIYKFLHLPVQSGNNKVLKVMKRGYTVDDFREIVESFQEKFPDLYLSTDIIAGHPGESREAFDDSCELMKDLKPDKINITRFTPMPNTEAKNMNQIKSEEKKRRSKKLTTIQREIREEKNHKYIGRAERGIVVKKGKKGGFMVRLQNYKPVIVEEESTPGEFVKVEITETKNTHLKGKILEVTS